MLFLKDLELELTNQGSLELERNQLKEDLHRLQTGFIEVFYFLNLFSMGIFYQCFRSGSISFCLISITDPSWNADMDPSNKNQTKSLGMVYRPKPNFFFLIIYLFRKVKLNFTLILSVQEVKSGSRGEKIYEK